jgi:hypothetical protein
MAGVRSDDKCLFAAVNPGFESCQPFKLRPFVRKKCPDFENVVGTDLHTGPFILAEVRIDNRDHPSGLIIASGPSRFGWFHDTCSGDAALIQQSGKGFAARP